MPIQTIIVRLATPIPSGGGNTSIIDLGIISAADVYAVGYIELLPAVVGRVITGVRFLADNLAIDNQSQIFFASGNDVGSIAQGSTGGSGFAVFGSQFKDTPYLGTDGPIVGDNGPLGLVAESFDGRRTQMWTPLTKYAHADQVIGSGHLQQIRGEGGTSGATEPAWNTSGGTTTDGTIDWTDLGDMTSGWTATVHAIAEVASIPGLDIPRPTSFEFFQQPLDIVAGELFDPPVQVRVLDQNGAPFIGVATNIRIAVIGAGTFDNSQPYIDTDIDQTTGIASWDSNGMNVTTEPATYQLIATFGGTNDFRSIDIRLVSDPFDVTAP